MGRTFKKVGGVLRKIGIFWVFIEEFALHVNKIKQIVGASKGH